MKSILLLLTLIPFNVFATEITLNDIFEKFNMRTIYSSYGQRLKYYCGTYPKDIFLKGNAKFNKKENKLELHSGSDIWVFKIEGSNKIFLNNKVTSATYDSGKEYAVKFDAKNNDWRVNKILIKEPKGCKKYVLK